VTHTALVATLVPSNLLLLIYLLWSDQNERIEALRGGPGEQEIVGLASQFQQPQRLGDIDEFKDRYGYIGSLPLIP
jgi:hypothetical protein